MSSARMPHDAPKNPETLIGRYVYRPFRPQAPGKIIAYAGKRKIMPGAPRTVDFVTVKYLGGVIETLPLSSLNDFESLIADHRKKLEGHEKKFARLKEMQ